MVVSWPLPPPSWADAAASSILYSLIPACCGATREHHVSIGVPAPSARRRLRRSKKARSVCAMCNRHGLCFS
jgi:hypothetical protein